MKEEMMVLEVWRTVVVNGKEHPWYSISNLGNVRSHLQNISLGGSRGFDKSCNPNFYKDLKPVKQKNRHGDLACLRINLSFPEDFFEDYQYYNNKSSKNTVERKCTVHELVMEAFRPMDEYPPDRLKDCWNDIPEDAKTWIKDTVVINHKDHDPSNNCVDNLEYVTQKENARAATKHYGGNTANKGKENDDCIKIIDPVFNPLLQEYEDGEIQFYGEEGEKYHNMLETIAKHRGISPGDLVNEFIKEYAEELRKTKATKITQECGSK